MLTFSVEFRVPTFALRLMVWSPNRQRCENHQTCGPSVQRTFSSKGTFLLYPLHQISTSELVALDDRVPTKRYTHKYILHFVTKSESDCESESEVELELAVGHW